MTIWIGEIGITVSSSKENYINNLNKRFSGFINDSQGQIEIEIVETNFKPEITKKGDGIFWFTMFSENVYVYIESSDWSGKAYICEETPVKYDAIDSMLVMIAAQFSPMFGSILVHGCCIDYNGIGICFLGDSGVGKSTLTKILSSDHQIIAEDMFCLSCHEDQIIAKSIPLGQKHFWVENGKYVIVNNICFVQIGEMNIEKENNHKTIFQTLLHNQFYKARASDILLMDAMRFNINRICRNISFYNFSWDAESFYKKDRAYIRKIKDSISKLALSSLNQKQTKNSDDNIFSLNKHIRLRENTIRNKIEIWDASVHRLYGITGFGVDALNYIIKNPQFTIFQLNRYLKNCKLDFVPEDLISFLKYLLKKNIIQGGQICDEELLYNQ